MFYVYIINGFILVSGMLNFLSTFYPASSAYDQNFEILKKYFSVDWKFAPAFFAVHSRKQEG